MTPEEEKRAADLAAQQAAGSPLSVPIPADAPQPNDPKLVTTASQPGETLGTRIAPEFAREAYGNLQSNIQQSVNTANQYASPFAQGPSLLLNGAGSLARYAQDMVVGGSQAFGSTAKDVFNDVTTKKVQSPLQPAGPSQVPPAIKPQTPPPAAPLTTQPGGAPAQAGWQQFDQRFGGITTPQDGGYLLNGKNVTQPATVMSAPLGATAQTARPGGSALQPTQPASTVRGSALTAGGNPSEYQVPGELANAVQYAKMRVVNGNASEGDYGLVNAVIGASGKGSDSLGLAKLMQDQQQFVAKQAADARESFVKGFSEANPDNPSVKMAAGMGVEMPGLLTLSQMEPDKAKEAVDALTKEKTDAAKQTTANQPTPKKDDMPVPRWRDDPQGIANPIGKKKKKPTMYAGIGSAVYPRV